MVFYFFFEKNKIWHNFISFTAVTMDFIFLAFGGALTLWLIGPQTKFSLHFSIFLTMLLTYSCIETEKYTTCVWNGEGVMLCKEISMMR